ncbi:aldehyde dehydrogenase family protein [Aneurinibacillus terranovensis]|uniref:aldehyde dehydrogenase family protein n=1 Tax=Aneurinibacillus terranovensis TaxID=278991 RepID=UPI000420288C|nr:aldehyde dehydrogenase family protein [Aneurinibacillus terranovensis]
MTVIHKMYIDGRWTNGASTKIRSILNPATEEVMGMVGDGVIEDAEAAIKAARRAFDSGEWPETPVEKRRDYLRKLADLLEASADEFARLETLNTGKPLRESELDVADAVAAFRYFADLACKKITVETISREDGTTSVITREPVGVCAQIVPWNFPLLMAAWKLAPALAAGNTCVFKPSELTPLTAIKLFSLIDQVGFPPGVVNLLLGDGNHVGSVLAESPLVDKIAFTGGTKTGRSVMRAAAGNMKNISLELGGKSPLVIFEDVDVETAVDTALYAMYFNQGQVCVAGSRAIVHAPLYDEFTRRFAERAQQITIGNGLVAETEMGPLISKQQLERTEQYVAIGLKEGARLLCGGKRAPGHEEGYYFLPTAFTDVTLDMRIAQEEIFGPILVIQKFEDEAEAIRLANGTAFGLAAGVLSEDRERAERVARRLRAGMIWINSYHTPYVDAPWGGYKQSGIGRELGIHGLEAYLEIKHTNIKDKPESIGWFAAR